MPNSGEVYDVALHYPDATEWLSDLGVDVRVLLLKSTGPPTFDPTHATVAAVLAHANNTELTDVGYARAAVPDTERNVNLIARTAELRFNNPVNLGAINNEIVGAALIYAFDTDDANSIPLVLTLYEPALVTNGIGFTVGVVDSVVLTRIGVTYP